MSEKWKSEDIDWSLFDPQKVNPQILSVIKAGSVIEYNSSDYELYLKGVFAGDELFSREIEAWSKDEVKHGKVLAKWIKLADPSFDFEDRFKAYVQGFPIDVNATESIRGSRAAELLTRCMIEIGTSTFYTAVKDATDEPLLKQICRKIAADELRHYKLFYTHLQRYQAQEKLNLFKRFKVTMSRLLEDQDDELPYAYYIANNETAPYSRLHYTQAYGKAVYSLYQKNHVDSGASFFCKAIGVNPQGWIAKVLSFLIFKVLSKKAVKYARAISN
ncbi:MAG TPA: ferritin-like domain-containing protein [Alphaproteobacteria bacterium]|nr:ferritin-like domain-containing protein [Alphaproteobacteria bacterium]